MEIYRAYKDMIVQGHLQKVTVYVYIVTEKCSRIVRFCK